MGETTPTTTIASIKSLEKTQLRNMLWKVKMDRNLWGQASKQQETFSQR
jgi:hypothetical protein